MLSRDVISWQSWVKSPAIGKETQARRKLVLGHWAKANGHDSPQGVIDDIILDKVTPYDTINRFLNYLRDQEEDGESRYAPSTIAMYRSMLGGEGDSKSGAGFFLSVLGDENFSVSKFNRLCPSGDDYTSVSKKPPTPGELEHILRDLASPRDRALLGMLGITAFRITEALTRKFSDITRKDGYATIKLQAASTKKRYKRPGYLTQEILDWIDNYHNGLTVKGANEWLFPGESGGHLSKQQGYESIKTLFEKGGLIDTEDEIYSPHSMRAFAISQLRKCGLQEGMVDAIVGHVTKTKKVYDDFEEIEKAWVERCKDTLRLVKPVEIVKTVVDAKTREELEKVKALLEFMMGKQAVDNLMSKSLQEIKAQAQKAQAQLEDKNSGVGTQA